MDLLDSILMLQEKYDDPDVVVKASDIKRPQSALDREMFEDANKRFNQANGGRIGFDDGGMLVKPGFGGTRQGYARRKKSETKMTVNEALTEIFKDKTNFLNRKELKKLVDDKTGIDVSINVLRPAKYPILKKVTYDTSETMKRSVEERKKKGLLSKSAQSKQAQKNKQKKIDLFKQYFDVDIQIAPTNEILGLDEEFKKKLDRASSQFRRKKLNTEGLIIFNDPKFFEFFKNEYQTSDDRIENIAKKYGYTLDEWKELPKNVKKNAYNEQLKNEIRIKKGQVPSGLSVDEIVEQVYQGKKIPGGGPAAKTLDTVYETVFRQEYDKLAGTGNPFGKADLSRNVEARLREIFGRPGQEFPEQLLPGRTPYTDSTAKNYFQYIDPRTQKLSAKNKIFSDYELELFDGQTSAALNKTKNQEKIFDIITKNPTEIEELSKKLEITPNNVRSEINRLLYNAIVRPDKPAFLREKENLISDLVNNLEATKTLDAEWNRSLKYLIYREVKDSTLRTQVFNKIDQFDAVLKQVQDKFPGVQVAYDHPASFRALKNQNFKEFLNVTPIAKDINTLKGRFDNQSNKNLLAMSEARAAGNNELYNQLLNKQIKLENTWSTVTGGKSSLGQIRLEGVKDFGTSRLDDPKKDLFAEFKGNIKIRQNIVKNLTDDIKKNIVEVLPRKDKETAVIQTLERVTNPDLIKQDKAVENFLKNLENKKFGRVADVVVKASQDGGFGKVIQTICKRKKAKKGGRIFLSTGSGCPAATDDPKGFLRSVSENPQLAKFFKSGPGLRAATLAARVTGNVLNPTTLIGGEVAYVLGDGLNNFASGLPLDESFDRAFIFADFGQFEKNLINKAEELGYDDNQLNLLQQTININKLNNRKKKLEYGLDVEKQDPSGLTSDATMGFENRLVNTNKNLDDSVINYFGTLDKMGFDSNKAADQATGFRYLDNVFKKRTQDQLLETYDKRKRQIDPTQTPFGDFISPVFDLGAYTQPLKFAADIVNPFTKNVPLLSDRQREAKYLREMDPRELYLYNKQRGFTLDDIQQGTSPQIRPLMDYLGTDVTGQGFGQSLAGGGIAKLAGVDSGPPPESGPNSQGLQGLMKRVKNL